MADREHRTLALSAIGRTVVGDVHPTGTFMNSPTVNIPTVSTPDLALSGVGQGAETDDESLSTHQLLLRSVRDAEASPVGVGIEEYGGFVGSGTEAPADLVGDGTPRMVVRTFAFLDLCGSTRFLEREGAPQALAVISEFRSLVRQVTTRRGVRVSKWMGDGAMVVGVSSGPVLASVVEICARMSDAPLALRGGVSVSMALLCDGDDYLARGANFAARLCDAAGQHEVLVDRDCEADLPEWVVVTGERLVSVRGMGEFEVVSVAPDAGTLFPDFP
jgi:adenylate cyclase